MSSSQTLNLQYLISEIRKLDDIIAIHKSQANDEFMISQYVARKNKYFRELINELTSPQLTSFKSYHLLMLLLEKFYKEPSPIPEKISKQLENELKELEISL
ncbi:MAG: hypothetical protein NTX61_16875 [Bacteroidetes bacterium]|nr:hypothetical protein [Bacteroidota bacterium]